MLGTDPGVTYRTPGLAYNADVANPKALNAVLPDDIDRSTGTDGSNVYTRAPQVGRFRVKARPGSNPTGDSFEVWAISNHFSSGPDGRVGQRREQAVVALEHVATRGAIDGVEREPPATVRGLESHAVAHGWTFGRDRRRRVKPGAVATPCEAVEGVEHGAAPVTLLGRRQHALETHAKRRIVFGHELVDGAWAHRIAEAGAGRAAALEGEEIPLETREKHEAGGRERYRHRERTGR